MYKIKDLNVDQLKILIDEKNKNEKKYPKVYKKLEAFSKDFLNIKKHSKSREDFEKKVEKIIAKVRNNDFKKMLRTLMHFINYEQYNTGINFLQLVHEDGKHSLSSITSGFIQNTPENRIFMLRATSTHFPIDFVSLIPEAYLKFEDYMRKNPDILVWFEVFIKTVRNEVGNNVKKLENYIEFLFDNLTEEKKVETLKVIEIDNELKRVYDGLCKYADVYRFANQLRKTGKTLNYGLKKGIEKFKDSNNHIKNLLTKYKNIEEVVDYLHNSYYKTKFKKYNEFC